MVPAQHANMPDYARVCPNPPHSDVLHDFCTFVPPNDGRALCEYKNNSLYYWINLTTNNLPIVLCAFEKYADAAGLPGRKTDYLAVGRYRNNAYVIFIELRKDLVNGRQWIDKKDQIEQASRLLCKTETDTGIQHHNNVPEIFPDAAGNMTQHKIVGVMIPVDHAKSRITQSRAASNIGGKVMPILPVSPHRRAQPTLSWDELLVAIGL